VSTAAKATVHDLSCSSHLALRLSHGVLRVPVRRAHRGRRWVRAHRRRHSGGL